MTVAHPLVGLPDVPVAKRTETSKDWVLLELLSKLPVLCRRSCAGETDVPPRTIKGDHEHGGAVNLPVALPFGPLFLEHVDHVEG